MGCLDKMNKLKRDKILSAYGNPLISLSNVTNLIFARQNLEDCNEIEKMSDEELVKEWKGLVCMNDIIGQISLGEMQRIDLMDLEISERKTINPDDLKAWYDKAKKEFEENCV